MLTRKKVAIAKAKPSEAKAIIESALSCERAVDGLRMALSGLWRAQLQRLRSVSCPLVCAEGVPRAAGPLPVAAADPHCIHLKTFNLPPQEKMLVITTEGIVQLGEVIAKGYLKQQ